MNIHRYHCIPVFIALITEGLCISHYYTGTSPWNPGTLASGTHNLHLSLSVPKEGAVELEAIESLTIPIRV